MKKQYDFDTTSRHVPTDYDRRGLGRDDPVWPQYVSEATKWDAQLIEGWHKGMDVILRSLLIRNFAFGNGKAALFSAIVTAFLIESHKLLKVDNEENIASEMHVMVELLQVLATRQTPSSFPNVTGLSAEFSPGRAAVAINTMWFISLTLSISVALLAMLVKQWGEGYIYGHDLSPPCVQARVRQARYDNLKRWRTEDVALLLPVLMHIALGLFLLGLVIFLHELNRTVFALVLIVVIVTFAVYIGTTLMPLFISFCPYDTPLSSRRYWALFRAILYRIFSSDYGSGRSQIIPLLPCQKQERGISESTIPDKVTIRALEWLIGHSQKNESVDIAIQAISSTFLDVQLYENLAQDSIIRLLAQKFTAIFNGALDREYDDPNALKIDKNRLEKAVLYGRALANITRHIQMQPVSYRDIRGYTACKRPDPRAEAITLMEDQVKTVERGLYLVSLSEDPIIATSGATSLSAWYTTTDRAAQSQEKWKKMLIQLIGALSNNGDRRHSRHTYSQVSGTEPTDDNQWTREGNNRVNDVLTTIPEIERPDRILSSLLLELAHWRWDINIEERRKILIPLIGLFASPLVDGPFRPEMSAVLATLTLLFHDHQEFPNEPASLIDDNWIHVPDPGPDGDNLELGQIPRSKNRSDLAQHAARMYLAKEEYMRKHTESFLFFGLAGLLDSISVLQLTEITPQIVGIVITQLNAMSDVFHSGPILLPPIFPSTIDLRAFMADVVTGILSPSPYKGQLHTFPDGEKARLLDCLWDKSYLWPDFGNQLIVPIVQLLHLTQDKQLTYQCLVSLSEYCLTSHDRIASLDNDPVPMDWKFFFSLDIPYRLADIINVQNETLQSEAIGDLDSIMQKVLNKAIVAFDSIMQMVPSTIDSQGSLIFGNDVKVTISSAICRLAVGGLLGSFADIVLCRHGHGHLQVWRDQLRDLPEWLNSESTVGQDRRVVEAKLHQFCRENKKPKPGHMTILILGLGTKLGENSSQPDRQTSNGPENNQSQVDHPSSQPL